MGHAGIEPDSATPGGRGLCSAMRSIVLAIALAATLGHPGAAGASGPIDAWREEASRVRTLADNNPTRAYEDAQRLQQSLPADATQGDRARLLNLLSRIETYLGETAKSLEHSRAAMEIAKAANDRVEQAKADLNISWGLINSGNIDGLYASATHATSVLEGVDQPDLLSEALLGMSMMYLRLAKLEESVTTAMQSMEIARHSKSPLAMTYASLGLAISFSLNDRPKEAYAQYVVMRDNARLAHSAILEAQATNGLGVTLDALGDHRGAEAAIREAVKLYRTIKTPFNIANSIHGLADHFRRLGRNEEALPLFTEMLAIYEQHDNRIGMMYAHLALSATYLALGNRAGALADAERAYQISKEITLPIYVSLTALQLATVFAAKGDYQRAYQYSLEASQLTAQSNLKRGGTRLLELVQRYETESRQREIDELTRRNAQQTTELRQRELQQRWLWTVLAGSVTVLAMTTFFLLRLRRSHAVIRDLNAGLEQKVQVRTAELRQQARYLRTLIDTLPWRVWFKDTDSRYLAANQAAADTCGLRADELAGKTDTDVRERAKAESLVAEDRDVMMSRQPVMLEEAHTHDGKTTWTETFKAPVLDEDGTVLGTVGLAHDISERKAIEAAREAALAEAQRLARLRSEFLAQMSHELRTPLNGILGYAQILLRDPNRDAREIARLNVIQQSGEHLLTLINDILDFAKIEAGKLELYETDFHFSHFLRVIAEMVAVRATQKNLEFRCNVAENLPRGLHADEKRLRQVLLNLLSNAIKFTERGMLQLDVSMLDSGKLRFEVRDTGAGIEPDKIGLIFKPFEQAGDLHRRVGGTGLGLAISQQFVHMMGGEIQVESKVGEGSRFWFELALQSVESKLEGIHMPDVIGYSGPRKKVLVVDDIAENRTVVVDMLGPLGFEIREAASGEEGLEIAQAERPDLILMDLVMPGMGGLEAIRRLRATAAFRNVPIIAVSASATGADRESSLAAGVNAFLSKPVEFGSLLANVANLLDLELVFESPRDRPVVELQDAGPTELPSTEDLNELFHLARLGNMQDVMTWAALLEARDARYQAFANQLGNLARSYQSKALLDFVKRQLEGATTA